MPSPAPPFRPAASPRIVNHTVGDLTGQLTPATSNFPKGITKWPINQHPLERFVQGILPENPVYRQLLGLCPTLAVTNGLKPALTMAAAVGFVLLCANVIISLIRNLLKPHLRIVVFTLTIATFVTIVDRFLAAYMYQMSKTLGPYIPLIIVNCIIICRCEVCASRQSGHGRGRGRHGQSLGSAWPWPASPRSAKFWAPACWPVFRCCRQPGPTGSSWCCRPGLF